MIKQPHPRGINNQSVCDMVMGIRPMHDKGTAFVVHWRAGDVVQQF